MKTPDAINYARLQFNDVSENCFVHAVIRCDAPEPVHFFSVMQFPLYSFTKTALAGAASAPTT